MVNHTARVSTPGQMERSTSVTLRTVSSTAKANGEVVEDPNRIVMKATMSMIGRADMDSFSGLRVTSTRASTKMMNAMATVRCIGLMVVATRVNGLLVFSTVMVG